MIPSCKNIVIGAFISVMFIGCGSDNNEVMTDVNSDSSTIIEDNIIDTPSELFDLYNFYYKTVDKSDYESTNEYDTRISNFIDSQGVTTYKIPLEDMYDADTQTLYVYDYVYNTFYSIDFGLYCHGTNSDNFYCERYKPYVEVQNINSFPFSKGDVPVEFRPSYTMSFYTSNIPPDEAERLHGSFYLMMDTHLSSEYPIAEYTYGDFSGGSYFINTMAIGVQVINSKTDVVYNEFNITIGG